MAKRKTTPKSKKPAAAKKRPTRKAATRSARSISPASAVALSGGTGTGPGDLELTVSGITLNPDPPVHNQSFTVSATVTPAGASVTVEVFVNGVLRSTKAGIPCSFSPAELGNPAAGDSVTVVVTATAPGFTDPASGSRQSTFA